MTTILPPNESIWDRLGLAIGNGFTKGFQSGLERGNTRAEFQNAFKNLDPNASVVDQLQQLAPVLHSPEGRYALSHLMKSQENNQRNQQFKDIFNPQNGSQVQPGAQNQPGAHASFGEQNQNMPDFSNISDDQLAKLAIVDPQRANALRSIVHAHREQKANQDKSNLDMLSNTKFSEGYQAIESDDMDALNKIISDKETPYDVKRQLTNMKNQHDTRKSVGEREKRVRLNNLKSSYTRAINFEKNLLSKANYKDKPDIKERIEDLMKLQRKDMKAFSEDPNSYHKLSIWDSDAAQFLPPDEFDEDEDMIGAEGAESEGAPVQQPKQGQKVKFNPKNPEHASYLQRVLQQNGGDRAKTNAILAQEFGV